MNDLRRDESEPCVLDWHRFAALIPDTEARCCRRRHPPLNATKENIA
jgi:hypothetical protein